MDKSQLRLKEWSSEVRVDSPELCGYHFKSKLLSHIDTIPPVERVYKQDVTNKNLVFVSCVHGHESYAYMSYISLASLFKRTDLGNYSVIVYCNEYLYSILSPLLSIFEPVTVKVLPDLAHIMEIADPQKKEELQNKWCKNQVFFDTSLCEYKNICCLDVDLFASGFSGSFKMLEETFDSLLAVPFPMNFGQSTRRTLNERLKNTHQAKNKEALNARFYEQFKVDWQALVCDKFASYWYNNCLFALPSSFLKCPTFYVVNRIFFEEVVYCDESVLQVYSALNGIPYQDIRQFLTKLIVEQHAGFLLCNSTRHGYISHGACSCPSQVEASAAAFKTYVNGGM